MEAVPRLHMLWFTLKSSPEGTSFANLKKYIAEFYQENPEGYSKDVFALETLRNQAMHPPKDSSGCKIMKRYYCQLHSLLNRFPQLQQHSGIFTFTWKDLYLSNVSEVTDMRFEMAAVLFNIAASHTQVGASVTRGDVDGMKLACTHFQCAAWVFGELRERYANVNSGTDFMTNELLVFMQQVSFAQAQECILEKSLIDNRKPNIVAKVTAQIIVYYGAALAALLTGGDDGPVGQVIEGSVYRLWKKYVRFKISYLSCILYLYQGQTSEEQQKMGERLTLYQAAWDKLEEARKESKGLPDQKEINESLIFTADVVEAKRKNAKNENEFIYHESVPELSNISAVQGANLVNGIAFSVTDPEVAGDDIFARLVPMRAHEASSMYSEEKAKLLRKYGTLIEEKDTELGTFMSSLQLEHLNISEETANKIPQGIVDRCAALNAKKSAIPDLIAAMSQLAEICSEVELNLQEIAGILAEEERQELTFQESTNVKRTPNAHIIELTREFQKYTEAHSRAGESNDTLRKAMELHVNNLKILARPLQEIQQLQCTPKLSSELNTADIFRDVKLIVNKVNEMKAQRSQFHADLRIAVSSDDITAKVIAHGTQEGLQMLFERELSKHERLTQLIDQNLLAQQNILQALTESYAKAAPILKTLSDTKHKRDTFFTSLAASYDVYEDLLGKSAKGLEFYKKLAGNVQKLLTRLKSARDVQSEERQQRLQHVNKITTNSNAKESNGSQVIAANSSAPPKLRDFLKMKNINNTNKSTPAAAVLENIAAAGSIASNTYIPPIRPNPLGSENPTQAACIGSYYGAPAVTVASVSGGAATASTAPNEPPPPYSLQQPQFYDPNTLGYTNPMYQQQQQQLLMHTAPPAYTMQAPPNSQFVNLSNEMANMKLQQQQPHSNASNSNYNMQLTASNYNNMTAIHNLQHQQQFPQFGNAATATNPNMLYAMSTTSYPNMQTYAATSNMSVASNIGNQEMATAAAAAASRSFTPPTMSASNQIASASLSAINQYSNIYDDNTSVGAAQKSLPPSAMFNQQQQLQQQQSMPQQYYLQHPQLSELQSNSKQTNLSAQPRYATPTTTAATAAVTTITATVGIEHIAGAPPAFMVYGANTKHPGYAFNSRTGTYDYDSGYQEAAPINSQFYGQYTSPSVTHLAQQIGNNSCTTDSENASKLNLSTGLDQPIISHTQPAAAAAVADATAPTSKNDVDVRYYNAPYGYQSNGIAMTQMQHAGYVTTTTAYDTMQQQQTQAATAAASLAPQQQMLPMVPPTAQQLMQHATYIQSGRSQPITQTTKSVQYTQSPQSSPAGSVVAANANPPAATEKPAAPDTVPARAPATAPAKAAVAKQRSNIDLLTDIDFSGTDASGALAPPPILPAPVLQPEVITAAISPSPAVSKSEMTSESAAEVSNIKAEIVTHTTNVAATTTITTLLPTLSSIPLQLSSPVDASLPSTARKSSYDNISIASDLSSLEHSFDWDSVSMRQEKSMPPFGANTTVDRKNSTANSTTFSLIPHDPFEDDKTLKYFHKEVERYEKSIESLNVKMLNGSTPLLAKWNELQSLLAKDGNNKRTTTIARLFPEKNRSLDCLPYDHARVTLEKMTDNYINAAYIKNLGLGCPSFIIAQTPQQNTIHDFWFMIWSQKARTIICLHTQNEILDPFWPHTMNAEMHCDDFTIKAIKINNQLSHCIEFNLRLSLHGADAILDLTLLQIKCWTRSSPSQVVGIARNALQAHQERCREFNTPASPLIVNCLTGSERSELIAIAICAILATQTKRPLLINVVDVWYRICTQRQNALRDCETLELSMQIVLSHAHDVLNKRGIMTSYQMKIAPQVASKEKEEIKDPLNELDPLWKLK